MDNITLFSHAKINLTLDILKKLPNNYHEIMSVMQLISLHDIIELKKAQNIKIITNLNIPQENNICFRTINLIKEKYEIDKGVFIMIKKNIPTGSGLAGGSSNAAAVIDGINKLWHLELSHEDMLKIAGQLGKDIPFFLTNGTALATGTGENIQELGHTDINYLIANPGFEISTKEAFQNLDYNKIGKDIKSLKMADVIKSNDILGIAQNVGNDFTYSIYKQYPTVEQIRKKMIESGALNASMSGSGPTVFGIFDSEKKMNKAYDSMKNKVPFLKKAVSINKEY